MLKPNIQVFIIFMWYLCSANTTFAYSRQDTLRGSNGSGRSWWDVIAYSLHVEFDTANKSISGQSIIDYKLTDTSVNDSIQIDLQEPMILDSAYANGKKVGYSRDGNVYWLTRIGGFENNERGTIVLYYHGIPRVAKQPPWDGGFIWAKDSTGKPWISVACQGLGASSWWPCKDYQGDEPDFGIHITLRVPHGLKAISNGKLLTPMAGMDDNPISVFRWQVKNPINLYNVAFYIGDYGYISDTLLGENGRMKVTYYPLRYNEERAKKHFAVAKQMLHCFEHWMGPYPFYEDGYKLVEAPFLGMEHQSAIAYGNEYKMGYKGSDRSATGAGLLFDFIIIHESGHEWYGNNITASDIADNWIHEGFTTYTEALFLECAFGKEKAFEYTRGQWKNILNNRPVIGDYGVNDSGPGDKYDKGSAIVHMVRTMMNDDEKFRQMLRDMNKEYHHSFVSTGDIEQFMIKHSRLDLIAFFEQYLRTSKIPKLEYYIKKKRKKRTLYYRFTNTVNGFNLPIEVTGGQLRENITITNEWQNIDWTNGGYNVKFSKDFLINLKL
ncbi:MAG: M1 family metallopeptidase [Chitinophagales bacterium]|nr:M1 family metallopeptidase [Chitinophagaceae bacterium]MCB9065598.1 M1 family metallopeptidase [Chitinophagales bacterium]